MKYQTLGYLVAIMSILSFAIMPRAKFFQTMVLNIVCTPFLFRYSPVAEKKQLGTCIGAAMTLLAIYCAVQARVHTTHALPAASGSPSPSAQARGYNSSASVVSAIWLFVNVYVVNAYDKSLSLEDSFIDVSAQSPGS